jgi:hypothetical protein
MRKTDQTELSNAEWICPESHLPVLKANGRLAVSGEAFICVAMSRLMARRLARSFV